MWTRRRFDWRPIVGAALLLGSPSLGVADTALPSGGWAGASVTLRVELDGFRNDRGRAALGVFDTKAAFLKVASRVDGRLIPIVGGRATVEFRDLKPGTYAVAVLHDENANNKLDFNMVGMPSEGYGFTNDAHSMFGPPSFEDAAMPVRSDRAARIHMQYFP
jgi:uncharacterized protein (DUF2141 family)